MGKIQVLDDHIANQIAAGEVVERPSSVVKELVENSVDAGSTRIEVTIEEGGLHVIRVSDNGNGMDAEDCQKAFFRHATSKITTGKDLFQIRTLGFRGEALPSIAAVAKVELVTSSQSSGLGYKSVIEGGSVRTFEETASSKGTDITVRELFFNTPARLKYMKTIQTELGHVSDYLYRMALAHPNIAFTLRHNGNTLLQTLGNGDLVGVIASIYGAASAKQMLQVEASHPDYELKGYISRPELTRSNRSAITLVVNGRYIRSYALNHAIANAYHTLLPINRHPIAVLHITMDPTLVDVNVHPSKLEVRFSKEQELIQLVESQIRKVLGRQTLIPQGAKPVKPAVVQEQLVLYRPEIKEVREEEEVNEVKVVEEKSEPTFSAPAKVREYQPSSSYSSYQPPARPPTPSPALNRTYMESAAPVVAEKKPELPAFPSLTPIGQMHGTYLLAQSDEGLYIIDQHAAHERINYEYYYEKFGDPARASQELLVPITMEFTPADAQFLSGQLPLFESAGVYMENFGGGTFIIRALPHWFPEGEEAAIVGEMADWVLDEKKGIDLAKLREKAAIMCSCKASIKANQSLSRPEMEVLLDRLSQAKIPYTCPHGRPIVISFSTYELEKMFKRVM